MTEIAANLFDGQSARAPDGPLVFVTNRYNLLEFLSAGYITPMAAVTKYYSDLLALAPGRIPIVRAPVSDSVITEVSREDATAFPVALELDASAPGLDAMVPSIDAAGEEASRPMTGGAVAYAPAGVLPLCAIAAVHFRSQSELDEHSAREYENIRPDDIRLAVTPGLFGGEGLSLDDIRAFLSQLAPAGTATREFYEAIDRLNGARAMLLSFCPARADALSAVAALLAGNPPRNRDGLPQWLAGPFLAEAPRAAGPEEQLFLATCEVLRNEDTSSAWRPTEALERIEALLAQDKLSKRDEAEISKNLRPISAILRNERDFKPFEPSSGLSAAKALLLLLLRPDPARLKAWERSETGADDQVMEGAGVLAGLLRGHKRLSLEMRTPALDRFLAVMAAAVANAHDDAFHIPRTEGLSVSEQPTEDGGAVVRLLWGEAVVVEKYRTARTATERLLCADLTQAPGRDTAIHVCRRLGWSEYITTTVLSSQGQFAVDMKAKAVRIVLPGVAEVTHQLDEEKFRERLSRERLPKDLDAEINGRLSP